MRELARRGHGERESGEFLLARAGDDTRRIAACVYFDDIDPTALNGAISIRGEKFVRLWAICKERGMRVIADVHTHPGSGVRQSTIDAANPMVATRGHIGIILPTSLSATLRPSTPGCTSTRVIAAGGAPTGKTRRRCFTGPGSEDADSILTASTGSPSYLSTPATSPASERPKRCFAPTGCNSSSARTRARPLTRRPRRSASSTPGPARCTAG